LCRCFSLEPPILGIIIELFKDIIEFIVSVFDRETGSLGGGSEGTGGGTCENGATGADGTTVDLVWTFQI
jgi:hypothetical protein